MEFFNSRANLTNDFVWRLLLTLCAISMIMVTTDAVFATSNDVVGQTLCRLVSNLTGGIATIAIFAVGVGLFLGKLNWGIAAATATGVGIIFSAGKLVAFLSGDSTTGTCPTS